MHKLNKKLRVIALISTFAIFFLCLNILINLNNLNADSKVKLYPVPDEYNINVDSNIYAFSNFENENALVFYSNKEENLFIYYKSKKFKIFNHKIEQNGINYHRISSFKNIISFVANDELYILKLNKTLLDNLNEKEVIENKNILKKITLKSNSNINIKNTFRLAVGAKNNYIQIFISDRNGTLSLINISNLDNLNDVEDKKISDISYTTNFDMSNNSKFLIVFSDKESLIYDIEKEEMKKNQEVLNYIDFSINDNIIAFTENDGQATYIYHKEIDSNLINNIFDLSLYKKLKIQTDYNLIKLQEDNSLNLTKNNSNNTQLLKYKYNKEKQFVYDDYYYKYEILDFNDIIKKLKNPSKISVKKINDYYQVLIIDSGKIFKYNIDINTYNLLEIKNKNIIEFKNKNSLPIKSDFININNQTIYFVLTNNGEFKYILNNKLETIQDSVLDFTIYKNFIFSLNKNKTIHIYEINENNINTFKNTKKYSKIDINNIDKELNSVNNFENSLFATNESSLYILNRKSSILYNYLIINTKNKIIAEKRYEIKNNIFNNIKSFHVDIFGNIYLLNKEFGIFKINKITDKDFDFDNKKIYKDTLNQKLTYLDNFIITEKGDVFSIISKLKSFALFKNKIENPKIEKLNLENCDKFFKLDNKAYLQAHINDLDNIYYINKDNITLFKAIKKTDNYYFGYTNYGEYGFVHKKFINQDFEYNINEKSSNFLSDEASISRINYENKKLILYSMPFIKNKKNEYILNKFSLYNSDEYKNLLTYFNSTKEYININENTKVKLKPIISVKNNNKYLDSWNMGNHVWYKVEFKDKNNKNCEGYLFDSDLMPIVKAEKSDEFRYLVALNKLGDSIPIYEKADLNSKKLKFIKDGSYVYSNKNKINQKLTEVIYKNEDGSKIKGYIESKYLQLTNKSITKIQILTICIGIAFILINIITFLIIKAKTKVYDQEYE